MWSRKRRQRGLSFIEVLVAGIAMVALLIPLLIVFSSTVRTTEVSIQEVWAQHLAAELIEQLKILPYSMEFQWIPTRPIPNPPPDYPNWLRLDAPDGGLPIEGMIFPADAQWAKQAEGEIVTDEWVKLGQSILWEEGTTVDPAILAKGRLYLSPLPDGYKRYLQLYRPVRSVSPLTFEENIVKAVVRVEWASARTTDRGHMRRIEMAALIADPRVW